MAKASGIIGVDHVAIVTSRIEEAERHYGALFGAQVLFRGTTHRGAWVAIDGASGWEDIRRRGVTVDSAFLRAGGLTIALLGDAAGGKAGPVNHVGLGCSDAEVRRIKEAVEGLGLRFLEDSLEGFKFLDGFGVTWEVSRGMDTRPPAKRLDLRTGQVI
jgi:catechol 2,3-dioxygenase-like lactoylglutathione lyase family enzyme